jgi:hypothetical protein
MQRAIYLVICSIVAVSFPSFAKENFRLVRGEGNRAHAEISLNSSNEFRSELACHFKDYVAGTYELGVQIVVDDTAKVSPGSRKAKEGPRRNE